MSTSYRDVSVASTAAAHDVASPSTPGSRPGASRDTRSSVFGGVRRNRQPLPPMTPGRGIIVWALTTACLLAAWFLLYVFALTPLAEARSQSILYGTFREQLALQVAPLGGAVKPGVPVALINAPGLDITDVVVVEGTAAGDLMAGPGHRRDTVLPGQRGVSVLYGRAAMFNGPFAGIATAKPGAVITVTTGQGVFTYVVTDVRHARDAFPQPLQSGEGRLTLATAQGSGRLGAWNPTGVVYLDAKLNGVALPYPPGRPAVVPTAETALQGDPSSLLPLTLSLPLLIGALVFMVWARSRWGGWQAWLVVLPLVLAAMWAVSQAAVQLLPNLV